MITRRQVEANRRNARASTGPKSATGKARSAGNARRHGLAVPICTDRALAAEAEALARALVGGDPDAERLALARHVAEAQIDVVRVRGVRRDILRRGQHLPSPKRLAFVLRTYALELQQVDRYERRAVSPRKTAIRAFDEAAFAAR
jgi:hypothetical protein